MADRLRQREIAYRNDVWCRIVRLGVASAIRECVKLFGVTEIESGLVMDPRSQPAFQRTMFNWIEWTKWKDISRTDTICFAAHNERDGLILGYSHDRRIETDADGQ
jgi:hypothetical protein